MKFSNTDKPLPIELETLADDVQKVLQGFAKIRAMPNIAFNMSDYKETINGARTEDTDPGSEEDLIFTDSISPDEKSMFDELGQKMGKTSERLNKCFDELDSMQAEKDKLEKKRKEELNIFKKNKFGTKYNKFNKKTTEQNRKAKRAFANSRFNCQK